MKAKVITNLNDPVTMADCERMISSARQFGINVEPVQGVYANQLDIARQFGRLPTEEEDMYFYYQVNDSRKGKLRLGYLGCCLAHYQLYQECVDSDEPIMIFEYDSILVRPLPDDILDQFDEFLNLDYSRHYFCTPDEFESYFNDRPDLDIKVREWNDPILHGTHGNIIKPAAARKKLDWCEKNYILNVERWENTGVNIEYCDPTVCKVIPNLEKSITYLDTVELIN